MSRKSSRHGGGGKPAPPRDPPAGSAPGDAPDDRGRFWPAGLGIFALALAVRLWHVLQMRSASFFDMKMGDARSYDAWARALAGGDWLGSEVFYQAPLYPYLLGAIYATLGESALVVRLVQALLGSGACCFIALACRGFFGARTGLVGGLMLALYAPAIFFDGLIQKSVLDVFCLSLVLWLLSRAREHRRPGLWGGVGAAMGALILTRENALLLVLPLLVWIAFENRRRPRGALVPLGLLVAGLGLVLLPVAVRNKRVGGEFHLTTAQLGPNLYIGNHPGADGTYRPLRPDRQGPEFERLDATELAQDALGRELTPAEVSHYWTRRAVEYATSQPADWLRLMLRKASLAVNATEQVDTEDLLTHATESLPLRVTAVVFHFGTLVPLALLGLWITRDRRRELWLLYMLVGVYGASVVIFYVFARYRYPLVPLLLPFAAAGIVGFPAFWRANPWPRRGAAIGIVVAAFWLCNRPMGSKAVMQAVTHSNIARALELEGRLEEAAAEHREALRIKPDYVEAHNSLGILLQQRGQLDEAIAEYRRALEIEPEFFKAHSNLGGLLQAQGRLGEAIRHHRRAVEISPDRAEAHSNLATALQTTGELDAAIRHYERAIELDPRYVAARRNAGIALVQAERIDEAIEQFAAAVALDPNEPALHFFLGRALFSVGRTDEAIPHYKEAVRLAPSHTAYGKALDRALTGQ